MWRPAGTRQRSLPDLRFAIPGDIETPTGGYIYDRRLMTELRRIGWSVEHLALGARFPAPTPADLAAAARSLAALPDGGLVLLDGLAYGAMPELAEAEGRRLRLVGLVHHPLACEGGLTPAHQERLKESERRALQAARAVICTSATTARTLVAEYGLASNRLFVAWPGTDAATPATEPVGDGLVHLLSVGTLTHRKGHDLLVDALAGLTNLPWRCVIAGSLEREPATAAMVREKIVRHGLGDRIRLAGASQDLSAYYARADVFVLATRHEGYGMAFAEALRHGLPVIGTTAGAVPEVVPATAGVLVAPDDAASLAAALRRMLTEPELRQHLATGARAAAAALPRWKDTAQAVAQALLSVS